MRHGSYPGDKAGGQMSLRPEECWSDPELALQEWWGLDRLKECPEVTMNDKGMAISDLSSCLWTSSHPLEATQEVRAREKPGGNW